MGTIVWLATSFLISTTDFSPPTCAEASRLPRRATHGEADASGRVRVDRSRPVPSKADVVAAWRRRQQNIRSFHFSWTEAQCHRSGWIPNSRHPERERLAIPAQRIDRDYTVNKSLTVDGSTLRYSFELDRAEEPDGVDVVARNDANDGLGVRRHYAYASSFDGQRSEVRITSRLAAPPPTVQHFNGNVDAQNLDARPIMLALRALDPVLGHLLLERAVTNSGRTFHNGRSIFLLEERHDAAGWKTILWIEPERDYLVSRIIIAFEQQWIADIDIDYQQDARWGWLPSAWRVVAMTSDGSRQLVSRARVTGYRINARSP
jgi:hypothetical protein